MKMQARFCPVALSALGLLLTAGTIQARTSRSGLHSGDDITRCDQIDVNFDEGARVAHAEQTLTIPHSAAPVLRAHLDGPAGITAFTGSGADYTVHVCKAVAVMQDQSSADNLAAISAKAENGEITVQGPDRDRGGNWSVYLIIEAPAGAALDFSTHNGPIGLRELSGKLIVRSANGPIGLKNCTGDVDASTENGPVSFQGAGGNLHLRTQNGPLSVALDGNRWQSGALEGSTRNGPVSLSVASGYGSGLLVESNGHSPMSCHADACGQAQRTCDDEMRRITLGSAPVVVRLSTENGPVSVNSPR
jgi:hypothetical protein